MNKKERLKEMLAFDEYQSEFELLETEKGEPGFWGGWRDSKPHKSGENEQIDTSLSANESRLKQEFRTDINTDIVLRRFMLGQNRGALAVFITGMVNLGIVNDFILRDGMQAGCMDGVEGSVTRYLIEHVFTMGEAETEDKWSEAKRAILEGRTSIFIEGCGEAILMDTRGFEQRKVDTAQHEKVIRGPQEGFTENIRTNVTLLRRIMHNDDLVCEFRDAGADNRIRLAIVYREGVANADLVGEVKRRLAKIDTRMIMNIGILEQLTETHSLIPVPQLLATERPDRVAALVMQGHVAVLLDGSPSANVMPTTLYTLMASAEDNYLRRPEGTVIRVVRFSGAVFSILLPAYFLSLVLYHSGLLSTEVLSTVISSRKMVFAPIGLEMVFLLMVFQLIREAGLRVPGSIGQAIGIIGGLILGQAAVSANLASSVVLIVVALSGLGNFCIPDYSTQLASSWYRIGLTLAAWMGGLLGLVCFLTWTVAELACLKSYGVPFLAPFAPKTYSKYPLLLRGQIRAHQKATDFMNTREES